jgi:ADP-ribose pyrophosphatase YjhB (NUDIX family)
VRRGQQLAELLGHFAPADARETEFKARMLQLLENGAAFSRANYAPGHFTASAFVVAEPEQHLLLIYHGKLQRWLQPGGHIEARDGSAVAAALREVREETGLALPAPEHAALFDLDIHTIPANKTQPEHLHFDVRFLFRTRVSAAAAGSDALAARWVPIAEVPELESDESVRRALRKLLLSLG